MNDTGVILLGRGGYSSAPAAQMQPMVNALEASATYASVKAAFVDQGSPSLPEALEACRHESIMRVLIVSVYLPTDRNLEAWISKVVKRWLYHRQPFPFEIVVTSGLGDRPELSEALLRLLERTQQNTMTPLTAAGINPNSPEWSVIPPAQKHVLVCRGPRCNTAGAGQIASHLSACLQRENLDDDDVLVAQTGCLFPCNLGPMMVVYPDGVWYSGLNEQAVEEIVTDHLIGGRVVEHYARYPMSQAQQRPQTASDHEQTWEESL